MAVDLKKIPTTPGIYKFFHNSEIIYIGKAKNLKKRVSSYFGNAKKDRKTNQIKKLTNQVETFSTKNEVEALLLEQLLIRENKPKFNILLRDDKTYPYIFFSDNHEYPSIGLKRTKKAVDEKYFGPFISSHAVKKSIKEIQKIFKLRNCSDNTFASRSRPCIEYQMNRCSAPCVGNVTKNLSARKGKMTSLMNNGFGRATLEFKIPSRGLIGFRNQFLTETRGSGIMNTLFDGYEPWKGDIPQRSNGVLVSDRDGKVTSYASLAMADRGVLFVPPGTMVYKGMIVGERNNEGDLVVNITKEKKLTNHRASGSDETIPLRPPQLMSLDQCLEFISDDEFVEVTPQSIRLRKSNLNVKT